MNIKINTSFILLLFISFQISAQTDLPDNYLPITMEKQGDTLKGACEYLEGFIFSMFLPSDFSKDKLDSAKIFEIIQKNNISGMLTNPNGKLTEIKYELVNHRSKECIYMKTSLGYFLWEYLNFTSNKISFEINWWYCPPAREVDLETLEMAEKLLKDSINWDRNDDRKCDEDIKNNKWSLFCAIKYASTQKMGEYNHHNTAMQTVRFVINDIYPGKEFEHILRDYNNLQTTSHNDILTVLKKAKEKIKSELNNN